MFYTLVGIIIVLAVLLVFLVLAQNSKGGVNNQFGGSASSVMGVQKTSDILEKLTWGFIGGIIVLSLLANKSLEQKNIKKTNANIEAAASKSTGIAPAVEPSAAQPVEEATPSEEEPAE